MIFTVPAAIGVARSAGKWAISNALWIAIALAVGWSAYYIYTKGSESCYKGLVDETVGVVAKEADKGVAAVKRASSDVARIKDLEQENARLLKQLDENSNRTLCSYDADELRTIQELVDKTKRN